MGKKKQHQQSDVYRLEVIIPLTSFAFDSLISNSNRAAQAFPATTQYAATHDAYNTKEFSKDDLSRRHFILKVCFFFVFLKEEKTDGKEGKGNQSRGEPLMWQEAAGGWWMAVPLDSTASGNDVSVSVMMAAPTSRMCVVGGMLFRPSTGWRIRMHSSSSSNYKDSGGNKTAFTAIESISDVEAALAYNYYTKTAVNVSVTP